MNENEYDFIYTTKFQKSNKYREWHKPYTAIIEHALEPIKEFIRNWEDK